MRLVADHAAMMQDVELDESSYWIIRLGVRHGTLDAYRIDRTDQRIATMEDDLRRREAASDEVDRP